jgi:hypothetical protein
MANELTKVSRTVLVLVLLAMLSIPSASAMEYSGPAKLEAQLSSDGKTMYNAIPAVVYRVDPNPPKEQVRIPARFDMATLPEAATSTFSITYAANGSTDPWAANCTTFPDEAKAAFNAAAAIWGNLLSSSVPITISACWSDLGSSSILGYSGGGTAQINFINAPQADTWYSSSLANAIAGSDLAPSTFDMHITYNSGFAWYYGTDGATPAGQYDLMSVVLHEIAHGLNFAGSMGYSGGSGSWGNSTGYPNIYDTFMRDGTANPGNLLINTGVYANPSIALGSVLTSNNIWFHGTNAMAANGGQRVKMYAPSPWADGSSYSHLDYTTFSGTANRLMVYAIASGVSTHDPGPVTMGIFKDMGWLDAVTPAVTATTPSAGATGVAVNTTIRATFSKSMNASTITTSTFYINNGVTGTVSYDAGTNTATFTPSANLALNTTYTATITTGVKDTGGHPMAANKTWSFTTTDGSTVINLIANGGFESSLSGWSTAQVSGTAGSWTTVGSGTYPSASPHGGSLMADFNSYSTFNAEQTRLYLASGVAIPSSATTAILSFWMYHDTVYSSSSDQVQAQVSTNGTTWINVGSPVSRYDGSSGWAKVSIDLSAYKGQSVQVGFLGISDYGNDIYLDDIALLETEAAPPTLAVTITGNGSVNSNPTGIACTTGNSGTCTHQFTKNSTVTLMPSASGGSMFGSWGVGCNSFNGDNCLVQMNADKSITATFTTSTVVRIPLVGGYGSLQSAYNSAPSSSTIQSQAVELLASPFTLDLDKIIVLEGGYDSGYSVNSGYTTMNGILTLGTGSLTVENLIIK